MKMTDIQKALPGMRNIKTAAAVCICILIWQTFSDEAPFFACIAAMITMQNSMEGSIKTGVDRMIGTLIGAAIGSMTAVFLPSQKALASMGIILVIHTTYLIKRSGATAIACIVFLAILLNLNETAIEYYILFRVIETFLGITVAVVVNMFMFPPKKDKEKKVSVATD